MIGRKLGGVVGVFLLVAGLLTCRAVPACAHDEDTWPVKHKLVGSNGGKSEDVSGIACDTLRGFPRSCLLIDDNLQSAQLVTLEDGRIIAGDAVKLIDDQFKRTRLELDGEGVAFAGGFYYVVGSHGHPRDKKHKLDAANDKEEIDARITAASQVVRVKPGPNGTAVADERSPNLRRMITDQPELAPFAGRRFENNGVTIEGIAIRRGQVFVGFRGPVLEDGHAPILSVALDSLFGSGAPNKHCTGCGSKTVRACAISRRLARAFSFSLALRPTAPADTRSTGGMATAKKSDSSGTFRMSSETIGNANRKRCSFSTKDRRGCAC